MTAWQAMRQRLPCGGVALGAPALPAPREAGRAMACPHDLAVSGLAGRYRR